MPTAHERYDAEVAAMPKESTWKQLDDDRLDALQQQFAGVRAERDALTLALAAKGQQVAGLLTERDDLTATIAALRTANAALAADVDRVAARAYYWRNVVAGQAELPINGAEPGDAIACPQCDGKGYDTVAWQARKFIWCKSCGGTGKITPPFVHGPGYEAKGAPEVQP